MIRRQPRSTRTDTPFPYTTLFRADVSKHYQMLINGQWTDGTGTERLDSYNPFDQSVWATIPQATEADVAAAIEAGHEAFRTVWRKTAGRDRAAMMLRLADLIEEHADELARIDSTDNGKEIGRAHV